MIRIKRLIIKLVHRIKILYSRRRIARFTKVYSIRELVKLFGKRNQMYDYFHHFYWNLAPIWLRDHREYFKQNNRGFGEDAFHTMWYLLFEEYKPKQVLEIGVYRGQIISLFSLLSQKLDLNSEINGISPFTSSGDSVSSYLTNLDYYKDVQENFRYFNLPAPNLHVGYSIDLKIIKIIESEQWDLIYIDGNHDYEVAKHDFNICSKHIKKGGLIVLDDASLNTDYKPPFYSTAGHPGPSKVAAEIDTISFEEILSVGHNRVFQKL